MLLSQPEGYFAASHAGQGPGVPVLDAWWGLNDTIKGVCDRLAREGFISSSRAAYLGHFAEEYEFEPAANVNELEAALQAAGHPVT
jgi:hypothetical protein